jgi:hypothetical protein
VRTVSEKLGLREGMRVFLSNAPEDIASLIDFGNMKLHSRRAGSFDIILFFAITQSQFQKQFPKLADHLNEIGSLWVCWPKSRKLNSDLSLPVVIKMGYDFGLVESKTISIDETWSSIKFTFPKEGKEYNNSYGTLKKNTLSRFKKK